MRHNGRRVSVQQHAWNVWHARRGQYLHTSWPRGGPRRMLGCCTAPAAWASDPCIQRQVDRRMLEPASVGNWQRGHSEDLAAPNSCQRQQGTSTTTTQAHAAKSGRLPVRTAKLQHRRQMAPCKPNRASCRPAAEYHSSFAPSLPHAGLAHGPRSFSLSSDLPGLAPPPLQQRRLGFRPLRPRQHWPAPSARTQAQRGSASSRTYMSTWHVAGPRAYPIVLTEGSQAGGCTCTRNCSTVSRRAQGALGAPAWWTRVTSICWMLRRRRRGWHRGHAAWPPWCARAGVVAGSGKGKRTCMHVMRPRGMQAEIASKQLPLPAHLSGLAGTTSTAGAVPCCADSAWHTTSNGRPAAGCRGTLAPAAPRRLAAAWRQAAPEAA